MSKYIIETKSGKYEVETAPPRPEINASYNEILTAPKLVSGTTDEGNAQSQLGIYYQKRDGQEMTPDMTAARVRSEFGHESYTSAVEQLRQTYNIEPQGGEPKKLETKQYDYEGYKKSLYGFDIVDKDIAGQVTSLYESKLALPTTFDMEPEEARIGREKVTAEWKDKYEAAPVEVKAIVDRKLLKAEYDRISRLWAGRDKTQMPDKTREKLQDINEQLHLTDEPFERRVMSGRATRAMDVVNFSRYSTHKQQQIAVDLNAGSLETAQKNIDRLAEMEAAAYGTLPEGEKLKGKIWYGLLGSAAPMGESMVAGAFSGGTADKAYWALQGQGEVITTYLSNSGKKLTDLSDEELTRLKAISSVAGAAYAGVEYIGGMFNLQGTTLTKTLFGKFTNKAVRDAGFFKKAMRGGGKFMVEWFAENSEEGIQGMLIDAAGQAVSGDVDLAQVLETGWDQFKDAAPATFGMTAIGGGASVLKRRAARDSISDKQKTEVITEPVTSGEAKQIGEILTDEEVDEMYEPSEQRELFKEMIRGDEQARAEFNQNLIGPKEEDAQGAPVAEEEIVTEPTVENGIPSLVGISRKQNNAWKAMIGLPSISEADYIAQTETLQTALDDKLYENTEEYVNKANSGKPLAHEEVAALLVRKAQITNEIETLKAELDAAAGNDELVGELAQSLTDKIDAGVRITEAARKGATANARALAAMAMMMDRKSYTLENALILGKATKGSELTEEERAPIEDKIEELSEETKSLKDIEDAIESGEDVDERELILDEVARAHRRLKKPSRTAKDRNADVKLIRSRQDKIFALLEELNGRKPNAQEKKAIEQPDSEGYLEIVNNLKDELAAKKAFERKKLADMKADRDRLDRIESEAIELIDELENVHRRIQKKKTAKEDPNADLRIAKRRQDQIFAVIDEINHGKPESEKVEKVEQPDSEGYLDMLTNLRKELAEVRIDRRLDAKIAELEGDIASGDIEKYGESKPTKQQSEEILKKRARILSLQKEVNRQLAALKPKTAMDQITELYDVVRGLRLTADAGHLLRQGGFVISNPKMWKEGHGETFFKESIRAFVKGNADVTDAKIMDNKLYQDAVLSGLRIIQEGQQLDAREEILVRGLLDKVPVVGKLQEGFGRVQITGVNLLRMSAYESYLKDNPDATLEEKKDVAFAINILTGFGEYKAGSGAVEKALNKVLISPRFSASRFQAPLLLAMSRDGRKIWQNKPLRKRIIEDTAWFMGIRMALMYAASLLFPDVEIGTNPDHFTFGRLIVDVGNGKKRIYDPWAGIQSAMRSIPPFLKGDATFGETLGKITEGRQHPALSGFTEALSGKEIYGGEISAKDAILKMLLPISIEGAGEAIMEDTGLLDLVASVSTDVMGIGSMLIDEDKIKGKTKLKDRGKKKTDKPKRGLAGR